MCIMKVLVSQLCLTLCNSWLKPSRLFCPWNSPCKNTGMGCYSLLQEIFLTQRLNLGLLHFRQMFLPSEQPGKQSGKITRGRKRPGKIRVCVCAKLLQSCPTLCDPMDYSLPGFSVRGILQAKTLKWVAMPSSRGSSQSMYKTWISSVSSIQLGSVQLSHVQLFATPWTVASQASCPSPSPRAYSNSCPSCWWCHPTILSSVFPFSSCLQSLPVSGSFPMSWFFTSGGQSIGASTSALVLSMNIQGWFPLGLTGLISLLSKGLSRVFSNTTVQKHQFFSIQPSLGSCSHIHTWLLEESFD